MCLVSWLCCTVMYRYAFVMIFPAVNRNRCFIKGWYSCCVESSWNVISHGDAPEGKWRGNWRMEWVVSTLHTTSEHGVSSITTADACTSAAGSRLNWSPCLFKWTRPFCRKTKPVFCGCAITFKRSLPWCCLCVPYTLAWCATQWTEFQFWCLFN